MMEDTTKEHIQTEILDEEYPPVNHIRIIYAATKVTEKEDPILAAVYGHSEKVLCMQHFKTADGNIGSAFFCIMKKDWTPPTESNIEKSLSELEDPVDEAKKADNDQDQEDKDSTES